MRVVGALSDRQLALVVGCVLFAGVAWPLAFERIPPYQDLLGHLATVTILANPDDYPEYVATGLFKTNAAFSTFCLLAGRVVGITAAARIFVLGVLAAGAVAIPRFALHFGGREKMLVAALVAWPMVHNWYVGMGMLNFALAIPCSLALLVLLDRQRAAPSAGRAASAAAMALATWYAHPFPVLVVGLLVVAYVASRGSGREAWFAARALIPSLVPAGSLVVWAIVRHIVSMDSQQVGATERTEYAPAVWQIYNLWAHWMYGFTPLSATTLVVAAVLAFWGVRRWREGPALLGPWPTAALLAAFSVCPYVAFDWGFVGSRLVPFVWIAAIARVPARVPRLLAGALGACAVAYWVGNGIDMFRLDRDQREYGAGIAQIPQRARVAFLTFNTRLTSRNTWSLMTASGIYTMAKHTNALDIWANTASMPVMRRVPPARWEDPVAVRRFLATMSTQAAFCRAHTALGLDPSRCAEAWREEWHTFWREAATCTRIVMWDPTADALGQLPPQTSQLLHAGHLWIFERSVPSRNEAQFDVDTPPGARPGR